MRQDTLPFLPRRLEAGVLGCRKDRFVEFGESLPGYCALEGIGDDPQLRGDFHVVRHPNKGVAPRLGRTGAVSAATLCNVVIELAAEILCDCERTLHPRIDRVIGVLESKHHNGLLPVTEPIVEGLARIQEPNIGGKEPGLRDHPYRLGRLEDIVEQDSRPCPECRSRLQAHPRFCDDPERTFRADHQSVGARACARTRQAPALDDACRRDRPQAFHEIVDVRVECGEMATRPGRDHATKRGLFHTLREMPQRQAVRFQFVFDGRHAHPALDARRPAGLVDFQNSVELCQVEADGTCEGAADLGLDATAYLLRYAQERPWRGDNGPSER